MFSDDWLRAPRRAHPGPIERRRSGSTHRRSTVLLRSCAARQRFDRLTRPRTFSRNLILHTTYIYPVQVYTRKILNGLLSILFASCYLAGVSGGIGEPVVLPAACLS